MKWVANSLSPPDFISFFNMGGRSGQRQKRHRRPVGGRARWAQPTKMQPWGQRAQGGGSRAQPSRETGGRLGAPGAPVRLMARTAPRPLGQACVSKSALLLHLHTINGNLLTSGGTGHHLPPRLVAEGRFWIIHTSPGRLQGLRGDQLRTEPPARLLPQGTSTRASPLGRLQGGLRGRKA